MTRNAPHSKVSQKAAFTTYLDEDLAQFVLEQVTALRLSESTYLRQLVAYARNEHRRELINQANVT